VTEAVATKRSDGLGLKIDGQGYMLDTSGYQRIPIAAQRQLIDDGEEPGDRSINGQGSWKRTQWSFDHGAGQTWWDEDEEADRRQFRTSWGVNPWVRRSLTLLHDVTEVASLSYTRLVAAGNRIVAIDTNGDITIDDDPTTTWASPTAASYVDAVYDGVTLYVATTTNIVTVDLATAVATPFSGTPVTRLFLAGGRLLGIAADSLVDISSLGVHTVVDTPVPGRRWAGVVDMGGETFSWDEPVSGGLVDLNRRSVLYRHTVSDTDGTLDPGDPVLELPPGEVITAAYGYSNVVIVGTNLGIRTAQATSGSDFAHGGLIKLDQPSGWNSQVVDFCGDGQFVWFTWTNFMEGRHGLGRLDLDEFIEAAVPAYATDLSTLETYVPGTTRVTSCVSVQGRLIFAGSMGAFVETDTYVAEGHLWTGWINFGSPERKATLGLGLRSLPLPAGGEVRGSVFVDRGREEEFGLVSLQGEDAMTANGFLGEPGGVVSGEEMEIHLRVLRATDGSTPDLRRCTLRTLPLPFRAEEITLPVEIMPRVDEKGLAVDQDPALLLAKLNELYRSRRIVRVQIGTEVLMGYIDGVALERDNSVTNIQGWDNSKSSLTGIYAVTVITTDIPVEEHRRVSDSEIEGATA
jgi:hypothetical protein